MKNFLLKILFLILGFLLLSAVDIAVQRNLARKSLKLPEQTTVLVMGDSHMERAIIPNDSVYNLSKSGDAMLHSYIKLRQILKYKNNIRILILGVAPHAISSYADDKLFSAKNNFMYGKFRQYVLLYNYKELSIFPLDIQLYIPFDLIKTDFNYGGYISSTANHLEIDIQRGGMVKSNIDGRFGNKYQMLYLDKIIDVCKKEHIEVVFLSTPVYHASEYFDTDYFYNVINDNKYANIPFLDYTNMNLPDSCRRDINHLNKYGAEIISAKFIHDIDSLGISAAKKRPN